MADEYPDIEYQNQGTEGTRGGTEEATTTTSTPSSSSVPHLEFTGNIFTTGRTDGYGTSDSTLIPNTFTLNTPYGGVMGIQYNGNNTDYTAFTLTVDSNGPLSFVAAGSNTRIYNGNTTNSAVTLRVEVTSAETRNDLNIEYQSNSSTGGGKYLIITSAASISVTPSTTGVSYYVTGTTITIESNIVYKIKSIESSTNSKWVGIKDGDTTLTPEI